MVNTAESPVGTTNSSELLMQWRVMKALGYKSLFDPGFRREMRNPFRRIMYYKLQAMDQALDSRMLNEALKAVADRVGYFSNPELYLKVRDRERQDLLEDPRYQAQEVDKNRQKYEEAMKNYRPMSETEQQKISELLKRV